MSGLSMVICGVMMTGLLGAEPAWPEVDQLPVRSAPPDPFVMFDGTPVKTREDWYEKRRPELKELFQHYMYGHLPAAPENVAGKITREDREALNGKAILREVTITFGPAMTPPIHLLLVIPKSKTPAPVFVGVNFCGNHSVLPDPQIALNPGTMYPHCKNCENGQATDASRGTELDVWCVENSIDRGYAVATFHNGDIDPDQPDFTNGVHPHYFADGQTEPRPHDWGAVGAWAWGLQRVVDYLVTVEELDAQKVCAIGHSRLGKTCLLAAAMDERIALAVPHQSGTGGCALSRDNNQETVERITRVFPHWFARVFSKFGGHEDQLPIDQHLLIALVAPRALLDTEGDQDTWANFDNAYRSLQGASEVYQFLGEPGLKGDGIVRQDEPIQGEKFSTLMQYRRDAKHVLNQDYWNKILDFADGHFHRQK